MGFNPLRQKHFEYIESHRVEASDVAHAHHASKGFDIANYLENIFYPKAEKREDLPNYLVKLEEKDETHLPWYKKQGRVTGLQKAIDRDFAIGSQVGVLLGTLATFATGGAAAAGIGAMGLVGGLIGGASDYIRNSEELENHATITPPTHFNRDAIKCGLGWALGAKFALAVATTILTTVGASAVLPMIALATPAIMALGAVYGANKGMDSGYERMDIEYKAATIKHQRPELKVSVTREFVNGMEGLALGLGTAVAEGIATNQVVSAVTNETVQMSPQTEETTKWRTLRPSIHANNHGKKNFMQHVLSSEPVEQLIHHF
jgi:hypothetical protein